MPRKILYALTIVHLLFQFVYMTLGRLLTSELGVWQDIFYLFRPEYMVVSGIVALIATALLLVLFIRSRKWLDVLMLTLNLEYIAYYVWMITQQ